MRQLALVQPIAIFELSVALRLLYSFVAAVISAMPLVLWLLMW